MMLRCISSCLSGWNAAPPFNFSSLCRGSTTSNTCLGKQACAMLMSHLVAMTLSLPRSSFQNVQALATCNLYHSPFLAMPIPFRTHVLTKPIRFGKAPTTVLPRSLLCVPCVRRFYTLYCGNKKSAPYFLQEDKAMIIASVHRSFLNGVLRTSINNP